MKKLINISLPMKRNAPDRIVYTSIKTINSYLLKMSIWSRLALALAFFFPYLHQIYHCLDGFIHILYTYVFKFGMNCLFTGK